MSEPSLNDLLVRPTAVYGGMALLAGMQLEVFTSLDAGPATSDELAARMCVDAGRLARLLYALVQADVVAVQDGRFRNTPLAEAFLVKGKPGYMGSAHELWSDLFAAVLKTGESVRTGKPAAHHDFTSMTEDEMGAFFRGLHAGAVKAGCVLVQSAGLTGHRALLDVGGGSGGLAIGACQALPDLRATVAELPQIAPVTRRFIAGDGMSDRIDVAEGDLAAAPIPGSFDVAMLRFVIQTVSAADAAAIIGNVGQSIEPGGKIHISGWVLDDDRLGPVQALNFDIVFLNLYDDGASYTLGEHRAWLTAAGFTDIQARPMPAGAGPPGTSLISATKA